MVNACLHTGIGTRQRRTETKEEQDKRIAKIADAVRTILEAIGEDPMREGLLKTPMRYAKGIIALCRFIRALSA